MGNWKNGKISVFWYITERGRGGTGREETLNSICTSYIGWLFVFYWEVVTVVHLLHSLSFFFLINFIFIFQWRNFFLGSISILSNALLQLNLSLNFPTLNSPFPNNESITLSRNFSYSGNFSSFFLPFWKFLFPLDFDSRGDICFQCLPLKL